MSTDLASKSCVPCQGGAKALSAEEAKSLLKETPGWEISTDGKWLTRKFKFKNFVEAMAFVNKAGEVAEKEQHHPDIDLGWGYANFKLQTHDVGGLHQNDFILAAKINLIPSS